MKNILYLFVALAFIFLSCSPIDLGKIKPKTLKYTNLKDSTKNSTATFTYNGNKIVSMTSKKGRTDFVYYGDFIVKETDYDIVDKKDVKREEKSILFTDGREKSVSSIKTNISDNSLNEVKSTYAYNANGTITKELYYRNLSKETLKKTNYIIKLTIQNGNLVKQEIVNTKKLEEKEILIYEYDNKSNPYKNVLGFITTSRVGYTNNLTKVTQTSAEIGVPNYDVPIIKYEYNLDGFPIKAVYYTKDDSISETIEYTY